MKIKQVSYRRLWNLGNYENVTVELVADVTENETAEIVLNQLADEAMAWRRNTGGTT